MPELPEVEVLRRELLRQLPKPAVISRIQFRTPKLRTALVLPKFGRNHISEVINIKRRSKYLIFLLKQGGWISHLGMSGNWRVIPKKKKINFEFLKHDHVCIEWQNGDYWIYNDPRRFGIFEYFHLEDQVKWFKELGPEPFGELFFSNEMIVKIRSSSRAIKSIIMDAKIMVGVGNIYASEALFKCGINPFTKGSRVSVKKVAELLTIIKKVLQTAIENGGSSIRDYVHSNGEKGQFQTLHSVYGREGKPCLKCGTKIRSKKIQGRSTFWCVECQT